MYDLNQFSYTQQNYQYHYNFIVYTTLLHKSILTEVYMAGYTQIKLWKRSETIHENMKSQIINNNLHFSLQFSFWTYFVKRKYRSAESVFNWNDLSLLEVIRHTHSVTRSNPVPHIFKITFYCYIYDRVKHQYFWKIYLQVPESRVPNWVYYM